MTEGVIVVRLSKAAREFNIGINTIVEFLMKKGFHVERDPNAKLTTEMYEHLIKEFHSEKTVKEEARKIGLQFTPHETITIEDKKTTIRDREKELEELFITNVSLEYDKRQAELLKKKDIIKEPQKPEKTIPPLPKPQITVEPVPKKSVPVSPKPPEATIPIIPPSVLEKEEKKKTAPKKKTKKEKKEPAPEIKDTKITATEEKDDLKIIGKIDLKTLEKKCPKKGKRKAKSVPKKTEELLKAEPEKSDAELFPAEVLDPQPLPALPLAAVSEDKPIVEENFLPRAKIKLEGPTILGSIILPDSKKFEKKKQPVASSSDDTAKSKKKKRKRIKHEWLAVDKMVVREERLRFKDKKLPKETIRQEITEEDIQRQIRETLARLGPLGKSKASKYRRAKRDEISQKMIQEQEKIEEGKKTIKVTEFVTANELANMMNVPVTNVISTCMSLGLFVSINQRLDAETLALVAAEFGYELEFVSVEVQEAIKQFDDHDTDTNLVYRPPIVTVMGHVDHGKTKLLDYIRNTNVVAGEAGGITQHIGAYEVLLENGKTIAFLDTPGHEAFTAMRARGAKVTDVAIIVIAADETVMPQTKEAINHALAAGVPIVFAINKMDKPNANPDKIREELSKMNILVEEWGGKYQSQEISAKTGQNVTTLLDKVLLEAEILDLKANPERLAIGTVIESSLDKGRGYIAKLLIQNGTLRIGDIVLAGATSGKVKAMYNERNQALKIAGPSTPVLMLGLNGAPQAGDGFNVMTDEKEAKNIANKRLQLQREQ